MPLTGAPRDLHTQLLACSSSQSVIAIAFCLRAGLCFGFSHPSLPLEVAGVLFARLHQLCRHHNSSSSIGDEFKGMLFVLVTGPKNLQRRAVNLGHRYFYILLCNTMSHQCEAVCGSCSCLNE